VFARNRRFLGDLRCLRFGDLAAHGLGAFHQRPNLILGFAVVPNPGDQPSVEIIGLRCAHMTSVQHDFSAALGGNTDTVWSSGRLKSTWSFDAHDGSSGLALRPIDAERALLAVERFEARASAREDKAEAFAAVVDVGEGRYGDARGHWRLPTRSPHASKQAIARLMPSALAL
jgi:hypothetical protein